MPDESGDKPERRICRLRRPDAQSASGTRVRMEESAPMKVFYANALSFTPREEGSKRSRFCDEDDLASRPGFCIAHRLRRRLPLAGIAGKLFSVRRFAQPPGAWILRRRPRLGNLPPFRLQRLFRADRPALGAGEFPAGRQHLAEPRGLVQTDESGDSPLVRPAVVLVFLAAPAQPRIRGRRRGVDRRLFLRVLALASADGVRRFTSCSAWRNSPRSSSSPASRGICAGDPCCRVIPAPAMRG